MKNKILIILVVVGLMLLGTMPTTNSETNIGGSVWSDGYVELTLDKMERTDTVPTEIITSPLDQPRPPRAGHDFVVFYLTLTRIEDRYVLFGHSSILFDDKGNVYTFNSTLVQGITLRTETGEPANFSNVKYYEANEGSKWLLVSEMPKDRAPLRLKFIYNFTESWENVSIKEGKIEVYLQLAFDIGTPANPYPCIFGMHNGTINPSHDVNVSRMYTYPCAGTGGHTKYAKIYNNSWSIETLPWEGYKGDWHNLFFADQFTLEEGKTYDYIMLTGSYPQIHHNRTLTVPDGEITCSKFVGANGKRYDNWIPAIRLE